MAESVSRLRVLAPQGTSCRKKNHEWVPQFHTGSYGKRWYCIECDKSVWIAETPEERKKENNGN